MGFMISTVIMPYANFEDAKSVVNLYNNSLVNDSDMNFLEFIGEKLIASGIEFDEEEDAPKQKNKIPNSHNEGMQIQSGVFYPKKEIILKLSTVIIKDQSVPVYNTSIQYYNFQPGVFRPPIA